MIDLRRLDHVCLRVADLDEASAELLFKEGYKSVSALSTADLEALKAIEGLDAEKAQGIIERAAQVMEQEAGGPAPEPQG